MATAALTRFPSETRSLPGKPFHPLDRSNSFAEGLHYASARRRRQQSGGQQQQQQLSSAGSMTRGRSVNVGKEDVQGSATPAAGAGSREKTMIMPTAGIPSFIDKKPLIFQFHDDKAFMKWKIPERLLSGSEHAAANMEKNVSASTQEKPSKLQASASNQRGKSENPDEPNKSENQMKVENQPKSGSQFNKVTENSTLKPSPFCQQDCNRLTLSKSLKSVNTLGENDVNGNHVNIDQMLQRLYGSTGADYHGVKTSYDKAGAVERAAINDVAHLLATSKSSDFDLSLRKWLRSANEREVRHAKDFFKSMMTSAPLQRGPAKHREQLQHIIDVIEAGEYAKTAITARDIPSSEKNVGTSQDDCRLRYVRQLTPKTRAQRSMYQSWHHLPSLRHSNDSDLKRSSVYIDARRVPPQHFLIHPDWV